MSKILCIPDVHSRKFWRDAVSNNVDKVDKVIFLGDYLDPYQNEIEENPELMECNNFYDSENLLKMLEDIVLLKKNDSDKYVLLCGNHTCSYIWSEFDAATRTDRKNWKKYHNFFLENLEYFNLSCVEGNYIFTHAGITNGWKQLYFPKLSILELGKKLASEKLNENAVEFGYLSAISVYRGGWYPDGSCEWADLREHINMADSTNDNIIPKGENGIYQVFGHTQLKTPLITNKWACLDCRKGFIIDTITHSIEDGSNSSL